MNKGDRLLAKAIAEWIQDWMKELDWSEADLRMNADINGSNVESILNGTWLLDVDELFYIATAFEEGVARMVEQEVMSEVPAPAPVSESEWNATQNQSLLDAGEELDKKLIKLAFGEITEEDIADIYKAKLAQRSPMREDIRAGVSKRLAQMEPEAILDMLAGLLVTEAPPDEKRAWAVPSIKLLLRQAERLAEDKSVLPAARLSGLALFFRSLDLLLDDAKRPRT